MDWNELSATFNRVTGHNPPTTFSAVATGMRWALTDIGKMFAWFKREGYSAQAAELKRLHPGMLDLEGWLRTKSAWKTEQ
jgi:hypothetical protein